MLWESVCAGKYGVLGECVRGSMMCSCSQYIIARNNASRCPVAPCVHAQVRTHSCTHALTKSSRGGMGSGFYFFRVPARCSCGTLVRAHTHTHNTHTHTHTHLHTLAHTSSFFFCTHKCTLTGLEGGGMDCRCPRRCAAPAIFAEVQRGHRCCYHLVGGFRCERVRGGGVGV